MWALCIRGAFIVWRAYPVSATVERPPRFAAYSSKSDGTLLIWTDYLCHRRERLSVPRMACRQFWQGPFANAPIFRWAIVRHLPVPDPA